MHCHEEPEKPNKYHSQLPVSNKRPLIPLQFARHSLQSQCWSFLMSSAPCHLQEVLQHLPGSSPCFWCHLPHHPCPSNSCWREHTHAHTPVPSNPFSTARVLFLKCKPVHCTTFLQTLQRFSVMLRIQRKLLNTIYRALHNPYPSYLSSLFLTLPPHITHPVPCEPATLNRFQSPKCTMFSLTSGLCMLCSLCPEQLTLPLFA